MATKLNKDRLFLIFESMAKGETEMYEGTARGMHGKLYPISSMTADVARDLKAVRVPVDNLLQKELYPIEEPQFLPMDAEGGEVEPTVNPAYAKAKLEADVKWACVRYAFNFTDPEKSS